MQTPNGKDFFVRLVPMPSSVHGAVVLLGDDTYDVFINSNIPQELQRRAVEHEIAHIDLGHLYNDVDGVFLMEQEADDLSRAK